VPCAIVPDNLKSGVSRVCRYEPDLNPSYQDFAEHYGVAILPARVRKPRDKRRSKWLSRGSSAGLWRRCAIGLF
jgi:transposase